MEFTGDGATLKLEVSGYELPAGEGDPAGDDRNWLVLRAAYRDGEGRLIKDSNACLLTCELRDLTAGLKVLGAGIRQRYDSDFSEPYFLLSLWAEGDGYRASVSFTLPNTMEDVDTAEIQGAALTAEDLKALIAELDRLCAKFPDRA